MGEHFKKEESREQIPNSATERIHFLLAYLLYHEEYIKIDELSDFLFVSRNTLSDSLRQVERIVNRYDLQIDRKPNFGVRIVGREYNFRRCIGDCFVRRDVFGELEERKKRQLASIADSVLSVMKETEIHMTETSLDSFIYHVYVAIKRIRLGHGITEGETDGGRSAAYRKGMGVCGMAGRDSVPEMADRDQPCGEDLYCALSGGKTDHRVRRYFGDEFYYR